MKKQVFDLKAPYKPSPDQKNAINDIVKYIKEGYKYQTLWGVTGSGKTFTMANVIKEINKPTLVIAHNKTLAAQLAQEFKEFFPNNAVHYFVSYYDYYQPEAYVAKTDTYIEKEATVNEEIDRLRHAATEDLIKRRDVIIVASVSCIYGIGDISSYIDLTFDMKVGQEYEMEDILKKLIKVQYKRSTNDFRPGTFQFKGDVLEIFPASSENVYSIEFWGNEVTGITLKDYLTNKVYEHLDSISIFPAKHTVTTNEKVLEIIPQIKKDLDERLEYFKERGDLLKYERLKTKVEYDIEMMLEVGYVNGIENYSRYLDGRDIGVAPTTLIDYFGDDYLCFVDESHMTFSQVGGMYAGDRSRKENLVENGFRLPSALDNRPLKFTEFENKLKSIVAVSATPGSYEIEKSSELDFDFIDKISDDDFKKVVFEIKNDDFLERKFGINREDYVIIKKFGELIGFARIIELNEDDYEFGHLWINKDFRGLKLGYKLFNFALKSKFPKGKNLFLFTREDLKKYYEDLGFIEAKDYPLDFEEDYKEAVDLKVGPMPMIYEGNKDLSLSKMYGAERFFNFDPLINGVWNDSIDCRVIPQMMRPTGLLDPKIEIRPMQYMVDDIMKNIAEVVEKNERMLITTITKRSSEELTDYLLENGVNVKYLHSDVETLDRLEILKELREGKIDVIVGVNLLREGLDLPEVSKICILDADKQGFLRSETSLIQIIGRAARNENGTVYMYSEQIKKFDKDKYPKEDGLYRLDKGKLINDDGLVISEAMKKAINLTYYRRGLQEKYNKEHGITPKTIFSNIKDMGIKNKKSDYNKSDIKLMTKELKRLELEMDIASANLDFEKAAEIRDIIIAIKAERTKKSKK